MGIIPETMSRPNPVMNKTLAIQLSKITGFDQEDVIARKLYWINCYNSRQAFLGNLEKELNEYGYIKGTKHRSNAYSRAVVGYDKQFLGG